MPESLLGMIRLNFFYPFGYIVSTYSENQKWELMKHSGNTQPKAVIKKQECNKPYSLIFVLTLQTDLKT